jgi:hypothetical protein
MAETKTKQSKRPAKRKAKPKAKPRPKAAAKKKPSNNSGHATAQAASKGKVPLLAGSAALIGAAGGVVLGASRSGRKVLGVKIPASKRVKIRSSDLAKVAKNVGHFGDRVGELTDEIRRVREGVADGAKNSPIEVLLRGLTKPR